MTFCHGNTIGWMSPASVTLNSQYITPLATGPISVSDEAFVGSIFSLGEIIGNVLFSVLSKYIGLKNCLLLLVIPDLVSIGNGMRITSCLLSNHISDFLDYCFASDASLAFSRGSNFRGINWWWNLCNKSAFCGRGGWSTVESRNLFVILFDNSIFFIGTVACWAPTWWPLLWLALLASISLGHWSHTKRFPISLCGFSHASWYCGFYCRIRRISIL